MKKISRTKTSKEEHREAEDDTQMTGPDRPEGEKLRESEGENRMEYIAFKHLNIPPTKTSTKRSTPDETEHRKMKRLKQEEDGHHELEQDKGQDEEDQ